ncbi:MAG: hypothetical protein CVU05_14915 [Bacteroidetes bacterium HGW-Bacteroidetes-21]|jgi:hypothetical protein|nr:MAG: hypothetical protein CVU05_14915 [Bacteroidetes bacterium HGW-Bacteroidetes-21]
MEKNRYSKFIAIFKQHKFTHKTLIYFSIFIAVGLSYYFIQLNYLKSNYNNTKVTHASEISGKISYIYTSRGVVFCKLDTNSIGFKFDRSLNFDYDCEDISSFLETGDSIFKKANNDSLIVLRKGNKYLFVLGKVID